MMITKRFDSIHYTGFLRYSTMFEPLKKTCKCGGKFNRVNLAKSNHQTLTLVCSCKNCNCMTIATRFREGRIR